MSVNLRNAVILDTETHKLQGLPIEIAYGFTQIVPDAQENPTLEFDTQSVFGEYYSIRGEPIAWGAMAVHNIIDKDLVGKPDYTEFKMPDGIEYVIGHNIDYDIKAIGECGIDTSNYRAICTLAMSRAVFPDLEAHNLSALLYFIFNGSEAIRDKIKGAHSAVVDITLTASLLRKIIRKTGISCMEDLYLFSEESRIPKTMSFGKHRGTALIDLEPGYINWLLKQPDLDPYLRKALTEM